MYITANGFRVGAVVPAAVADAYLSSVAAVPLTPDGTAEPGAEPGRPR